MTLELDFSGITALMKEMEEAANDYDIQQANKRILKRAIPFVHEAMQKNVPKSDGKYPSGKRGYRPSGHAKDKVPISKIRTRGTTAKVEVGWPKLTDSSEFFYLKFVEWGTIRQHPRRFVEQSIMETEDRFVSIAKEEYGRLVKQIGQK